jgi:O-antigen/teichoic acid export membrane protein
VFGGTGEEDAEADAGDRPGAADPRRAVCTGVVLTLAACTAAVALAWVLREPLSRLLTGDEGETALVLLAAASAAPAAMLRLLANVMRYGRRMGRYVVADLSRTVFVLAGACVLLASGGGVREALLVYVAGGSAAVLVALVLVRHDVRPAISLDDARHILGRGAPIMPVALSNWTVQNSDTFFLSLYASSASVGVYRVATGISRIGAYTVSLFMRSWGPVAGSVLGKAVDRDHGRAVASARTLEFYVVGCCWLLLGLAAFGDLLVRIAPAAYGDAAPLLPLLAATFVLRGTFVLSYHGSGRSDRRRWMFALFIVAAAVFIGACVALIPPLGSTGAALAGPLGFATATAVMLTLAQRGPDPMPLEWRRPAGALAIGGALYAVVTLAGPPAGDAGYALDAAVVVAYPLLALALGLVPGTAVPALLAAGRATVPSRRRSAGLADRLAQLDASDVELLDRAVRQRQPVELLATEQGEHAVRLRLAVLLLRLSALDDATAVSADLASYALEDESVVRHEALARRLSAAGADPYTLDALHETAVALRALPRRRWPAPPVAASRL